MGGGDSRDMFQSPPPHYAPEREPPIIKYIDEQWYLFIRKKREKDAILSNTVFKSIYLV